MSQRALLLLVLVVGCAHAPARSRTGNEPLIVWTQSGMIVGPAVNLNRTLFVLYADGTVIFREHDAHGWFSTRHKTTHLEPRERDDLISALRLDELDRVPEFTHHVPDNVPDDWLTYWTGGVRRSVGARGAADWVRHPDAKIFRGDEDEVRPLLTAVKRLFAFTSEQAKPWIPSTIRVLVSYEEPAPADAAQIVWPSGWPAPSTSSECRNSEYDTLYVDLPGARLDEAEAFVNREGNPVGREVVLGAAKYSLGLFPLLPANEEWMPWIRQCPR